MLLPLKSIERVDGTEAQIIGYDPYSFTKTDGVRDACVGKNVAMFVVPQFYTSVYPTATIGYALSRLHVIGSDIDLVVGLQDDPTPETYLEHKVPAWTEIEDMSVALDAMGSSRALMEEIRQVAASVTVLYDHSGREDAVLDPHDFAYDSKWDVLISGGPGLGVPVGPGGESVVDPVFTGDIEAIAGEEVAREMEDAALRDAKIDFLRLLAYPTPYRYRLAGLPDEAKGFQRATFECFCMGMCEFPMDDEEVSELSTVTEQTRRQPFDNVFMQSMLESPRIKEDMRRISHAKFFFTDALRIWDKALALFGVPLTVSNWNAAASNRKWDVWHMEELGRLIGVDAYLSGLVAGLAVDDMMIVTGGPSCR